MRNLKVIALFSIVLVLVGCKSNNTKKISLYPIVSLGGIYNLKSHAQVDCARSQKIYLKFDQVVYPVDKTYFSSAQLNHHGKHKLASSQAVLKSPNINQLGCKSNPLDAQYVSFMWDPTLTNQWNQPSIRVMLANESIFGAKKVDKIFKKGKSCQTQDGLERCTVNEQVYSFSPQQMDITYIRDKSNRGMTSRCILAKYINCSINKRIKDNIYINFVYHKDDKASHQWAWREFFKAEKIVLNSLSI